jgi:asparagine synthase (glutamine-hydrolysing)
MSGIIGIFNRDGAPVDDDLLREMTRFMAFRGPDAQQVRVCGAAGLGHALLRTTHESEREQQPCALDFGAGNDDVWISADARVDARAELIGKLEAAGRRGTRQATDPELILHAYHVWGEECVQHLIGDFAFIIWDGPRRRWFCARDHFGLKPFYYAEAGRSLLCSNTLNCLRLHPEVSDELNDLAVADYLLFDWNEDPATTFFAGIRQLPGGHTLVCTEDGIRIHRYWSLPYDEIRFKRGNDYVERFLELFEAAVKDRIRTDKVVVCMSGGLDSTMVAAVAHKVLGKPSESSGVRAYTCVYDKIISDQERKYSGLAADYIGIPIDYHALDEYQPLANVDWQLSKPEPSNEPMATPDGFRRLSAYTRVVLNGSGGDPALATNDGYIANYLKIGTLGELISGIGWCVRASRGIPRLGFRRLIKKKAGLSPPVPFSYPDWLNADFANRLELRSRSDRIEEQTASIPHIRSAAHEAIQSSSWQVLFSFTNPGSTQFGVEVRQPFFDTRVMQFLTSIPPLPWCQEKNLLRAAGRGLLPDEVRFRRKTPLSGNPLGAHLRGYGPDWWERHFDPVPEFSRYVNVDAWNRGETPDRQWIDLRLVALNYWLQLGRKSHKLMLHLNRGEKRS